MVSKMLLGFVVLVAVVIGVGISGIQFSVFPQTTMPSTTQLVGKSGGGFGAVNTPTTIGSTTFSFVSSDLSSGGQASSLKIIVNGVQNTLSSSQSKSFQNNQIKVTLEGIRFWSGSGIGPAAGNIFTVRYDVTPDITTSITLIPDVTVAKSQVAKANINVNNNFGVTPVRIYYGFGFETPFGLATKVEKNQVIDTTLQPGLNTYEVVLPTNVAGKLTVSAVVKLLVPEKGTELFSCDLRVSNWQSTCWDANIYYPGCKASFETASVVEGDSAGGGTYVLHCYVVEREKEITPLLPVEADLIIVPQPIYISQNCTIDSCPANYSCKYITKLGGVGCLRNDILNLDLDCLTFGCPNITNANYVCTSAGICAEQVIAFVDCRSDPSICGAGQTCVVNTLNTSAYCLKTELVNIVNQCTNSLQCAAPCKGITTQCMNGLCDYQGSCESITIGCREIGCEQGYVCNEDLNTCERTLIRAVIPLWVWVLIGIALLIVALMFVRRL